MSKEKAAQEAAKTEPAAKAGKKGSLMYLGPTITGAARHGTVYKDGVLPKKAQECIAEFPQMSRLFVEVDRVPEVTRELGRKQGALGTIYDQAAERFNAQKFTRRV